jgi:ATP adenylyltransferase
MTKADLIDEVSRVSSLTKKETETIVNTVFDNITDALAKGDKVELRGFGSFRIRHRNSRKGRNPKTGDAVSVPEKRVPFFKVGKRLRELVNTEPCRGDRLWAPWRMNYVTSAGAPDAACVFCSALSAGDDRRVLILRRGRRAFLILNAFPYATGHLMAMPIRHVGKVEDATADELAETMILVQDGVRALNVGYKPDGFNIGMNLGRVSGAGVLGHLHTHVVPRWNGDTNFMPVIADTKVLPETLETTYDRLTALLRA